MLTRLAMVLQQGQIEAIGGQGFGGQGGTIVVDDNCEVWSSVIISSIQHPCI